LRQRRYAGDAHHNHYHSGWRAARTDLDGRCIVPLTSPVDRSPHALMMVSPARGEASWQPISSVAEHHKGTHTHMTEDLAPLLRAGQRVGSRHLNLPFFFHFFRAHTRINPGLCVQDRLRIPISNKKRGSSTLKFLPQADPQARTGAQVGTPVRDPRDLTGKGERAKKSWWPTTFRWFGSALMMWTNRRSMAPGRPGGSPGAPTGREFQKKPPRDESQRHAKEKKKFSTDAASMFQKPNISACHCCVTDRELHYIRYK
jgi:hypothetical protein